MHFAFEANREAKMRLLSPPTHIGGGPADGDGSSYRAPRWSSPVGQEQRSGGIKLLLKHRTSLRRRRATSILAAGHLHPRSHRRRRQSLPRLRFATAVEAAEVHLLKLRNA